MQKNNVNIIELAKQYFYDLKKSWTDLYSFRTKRFNENLQSLRNFILLITLLEFLIMLITGFAPIVFTGDNLTGTLLLIHVTIAPFISLSFAILVVIFAQSNRFDSNDISVIEGEQGKKKIQFKNDAFLKIIFWSISFLSLPAMVSIILGMFPIFGTDGQIILLEIHKYSVLIISIMVILHIGILSVKLKTKNE